MSRKQSFLSTFFFFSLLVSLSLSNPEETTALLEFKAASDPSNALSSWVASSDPSHGSWLGVSCDPKTHRVTRLILESLNLTGSTQPLAQLAHLKVLSLNHNLFSSFPNFSSLHNLNHLYLSHNRFSGPIPAGITSLRHLRRLDLSHNHLSGEIPMTEFTQLPLLTLRLESNSFTGPLSSPNSYSGSISDFDVSHNNLSGEIPSWMSGFGVASFAGNDHLCGKPLPYECSNRTAHIPFGGSDQKHGGSGEAVVVTISSVGIAAVLLGMAVVVTRCRGCTKRGCSEGGTLKRAPNGYGYVRKHYGPGELKMSKKRSGARSTGHGLHGPGGGPRESEDMVVLEGGCKGVSKVSDLLKASAEMLGKGSVGTTYKVAVDGGDVVVVKRVREKRIGGKEVDGLLRRVGRLSHENIVGLRAYNNSSYELLLVYDLMPNGSLNFVLHGNRGPGRTLLDWATRFKLALGSAQGLAFLHGCDKDKAEKLFHGHITSSNILIDHMGNACIADIGLQQLCPAHFSSHSGYKAPELLLPNKNRSTKFSQKCDVYSFGVVLLEILTGRVVDGEEGEMGLVEWVGKHRECTWEVLDFELLGDKEMKEEMWALWEVALLCVAPLPKDRPTMGMVHRMIQNIGKKGVGEDGTKSILDDLTTSDSSSPSDSGSTP